MSDWLDRAESGIEIDGLVRAYAEGKRVFVDPPRHERRQVCSHGHRLDSGNAIWDEAAGAYACCECRRIRAQRSYAKRKLA